MPTHTFLTSLALLSLAAVVPAQDCELSKLTDCMAPVFTGAGDPEDYGESVALDGDLLVVGSPGANAGVSNDGCAFVYELDGLNWFLTAVLEGPGFTPSFGEVVAVDGDVIVAANRVNRVNVFERDSSGNWAMADAFEAPDQFHQLGRSLAVDGLRFLAGGSQNPNRNVHVFEKQGATWVDVHTIEDAGTLDSANFGQSIDLEGDVAVIGAPGENFVYVFEFDGLDWQLLDTLQPADPGLQRAFGTDVAISGGRIAVGAPGADLGASLGGAVVLYTRSGNTWVQEDAVTAADVAQGDGFGRSVDLVGTRLVAGSPGKDATSSHADGGGYVFDLVSTTWTETANIVPPDRDLSDQIGSDVATNGGDLVVLNSPGDDDQGPEYGAVYTMSASGANCRTLRGYPPRVSVTNGGSVTLEVRAGFEEANRMYLIAGTFSGTSPGIPLAEARIPLNIDGYFRFSIRNANGPSFPNTMGVLNGQGRANAQVIVPPGLSLDLAGLKLHHAFVVFEGPLGLGFTHVSNAFVTRLDP